MIACSMGFGLLVAVWMFAKAVRPADISSTAATDARLDRPGPTSIRTSPSVS